MAITFANWLRHEGEFVREGEPIFELDTEKVRLQVEALADGVLTGFRVEPGDVVIPRQVVATIELGDKGPRTSGLRDDEDLPLRPRQEGDESSRRGALAAGASPKARRLAEAAAIDLKAVVGTGPGGMITEPDVEVAIERRARSGEGHPE